MGIERHFDFRKEMNEALAEERGERQDEAFDAAFAFIEENISDPHLNVDITKLTDEDLEFARKFQNNELTEEEIAEGMEHLPDGSPSSNFRAALRNKLVVREGMRKRMERMEQKLREEQNNDTV